MGIYFNYPGINFLNLGVALADFCAFREIPFLSYKKGAVRSAPIPQGAVASDAPPRRECEGLIDPSALPDATLAESKWAWREGAKPGICLQRAPLPSPKVLSSYAHAVAFEALKRPTLHRSRMSWSNDRPSHPRDGCWSRLFAPTIRQVASRTISHADKPSRLYVCLSNC